MAIEGCFQGANYSQMVTSRRIYVGTKHALDRTSTSATLRPHPLSYKHKLLQAQTRLLHMPSRLLNHHKIDRKLYFQFKGVSKPKYIYIYIYIFMADNRNRLHGRSLPGHYCCFWKLFYLGKLHSHLSLLGTTRNPFAQRRCSCMIFFCLSVYLVHRT